MAKGKSKKIQPKSNKTNLVYGLVLFVISFVLYANTIGHDYALDDVMLIKENAYTQSGFSGIGDILTNDMFSGNNPGYKSDLSGGRYRPLSQITFAIEYELFGLNPQVGHFINIVLFALTPFMIFIILSLLLRTDGKDFNWYSSLPFLAGLIYAVHPIHTEAVANIKGRDEIMSMLLVLVCFYYFIKYIDFSKTKDLVFSVIIFFLALMAKENAITFLAVIPLAIIMFREKNLGDSVKKILPFLAVAVVFVIIRQSIVGGGKELAIPELMNEPFYGMSFLEKYGTILVTLFNYVKLQFIPYPLTFDYYPYHIAKTNLFDILPVLAILIHLLLIYVAYKTWKIKPIISFAILYYFITLSIVSNLFFTIGAFMNERFIYMPSLAVCIVFAWFVSDYLVNKKLPKNALIGIIAIVTLAFSVLTVMRNPVWADNFTLMTTDVNTSSNSAFGNYCAGLQYSEKMKTLTDLKERQSYYEKSLEYLYKAIEIHPRYSNAFIALGNVYYEKDQSFADSTIHYYTKSFEVYPSNYSVSLNLARLHRDIKKDAKSSEFYLNNCIKVNPNKWEAYNEMGVIYFNTNRVSESVQMFENALSRETQNKQIYTNLAAAYKAMGDTEKANLYSNQAKMLR